MYNQNTFLGLPNSRAILGSFQIKKKEHYQRTLLAQFLLGRECAEEQALGHRRVLLEDMASEMESGMCQLST